MNRVLRYGIVVVITAIVVGIATYFVVNHLSMNKENKLNAQIISLKNEVSSLSSQVTNLKSTEVSSSNSGDGTQTVFCQSSSLTASLSNGNGTAGAYYYMLSLKNITPQTCHYDGYTTLFEAGVGGTVIGQNAVVSATADINIPSGKSISSPIRFPDPSNFTGGQCVNGVTSLIVYPPGQTSPLTINNVNIPTGNDYCPGFSLGDLTYN